MKFLFFISFLVIAFTFGIKIDPDSKNLKNIGKKQDLNKKLATAQYSLQTHSYSNIDAYRIEHTSLKLDFGDLSKKLIMGQVIHKISKSGSNRAVFMSSDQVILDIADSIKIL